MGRDHMASTETRGTGGVGFIGLLGILFIGLKLTGFIDWPWWVVLSPLWGYALLVVLLLLVTVVATVLEEKK